MTPSAARAATVVGRRCRRFDAAFALPSRSGRLEAPPGFDRLGALLRPHRVDATSVRTSEGLGGRRSSSEIL